MCAVTECLFLQSLGTCSVGARDVGRGGVRHGNAGGREMARERRFLADKKVVAFSIWFELPF